MSKVWWEMELEVVSDVACMQLEQKLPYVSSPHNPPV
jgi:hypothetical protein